MADFSARMLAMALEKDEVAVRVEKEPSHETFPVPGRFVVASVCKEE